MDPPLHWPLVSLFSHFSIVIFSNNDLNHVGRLSHFSPVLTGDVLETFSPPNTPELGLGLTMT
jgi:hypothetical protein